MITKAELEKMVGRTMDLTLKLWERQIATNQTILFLIQELLKLQALYLRDNKKTPYKRIEELELMVKGMNDYYQRKLTELRHPTSPLKKKGKDYKYTNVKKD
jgi:hypothetical protein